MNRRYIMAAILIEDAGPETRRREVELEDQIRDRLTCAPLMVEGDRIDVEHVEIDAQHAADDEGNVCVPSARPEPVGQYLFETARLYSRMRYGSAAGEVLS